MGSLPHTPFLFIAFWLALSGNSLLSAQVQELARFERTIDESSALARDRRG